MNTKKWWLAAFGLGCLVLTAWGRSNLTHRFADTECVLCHVDVRNDAPRLKPMTSDKCEECHRDRRAALSHPFDIVPEISIPADLPLAEGKLTCSTCHFTHPFSIRNAFMGAYLLRRPGKGAAFCSVCHRIDAKGHILFDNVHQGSFQETNRSQSLDEYTLQCIECHDRHVDRASAALGSGNWLHRATNLNHPVGVLYQQAQNRKPGSFQPQTTLSPEIRLYNGKIGCGTCHNVYSKQKAMLVVGNRGSSLCLQCHVK